MSIDESTMKLGVATTGGLTVFLASALAFVMLRLRRGGGGKSGDEEAEAAAAAAAAKAVAAEIDEAEYPGGSVCVYFATQTGTAESFAKELEREGKDHGFHVHIVDLEDVACVEDLVDDSRRNKRSGTARAVVLAATYGEGEPTDNAMAFVQSLKDRAGTDMKEFEIAAAADEGSIADDNRPCQRCLVGLDFCVFGLGNRQYDHYNAMGKFFDKMFGVLGGTRLAEIGLGDDDKDLEGDFEAWRENVLWPTLEKKYLAASESSSSSGRKHHNGAIKDKLPDCQYVVEYHDGDECARPEELPLDKVHGQSRHYFTSVDCPVTAVRELRSAEDPGSTLHVEIDISKAKNLSYETADNLGILPLNAASVVESVAESLGYDLDARFSLRAAPGHDWHGAPFPMPISIRECLTRYCDLTSAPLRSDLKLLAAYAKDPTDQKALLRMSSKEGKAEYREKVVDAHVGLVDLLRRCPSIEIPLEHLLNLCPLLQTRFYTISSSSSVHPDTVHLTVAVTRYDREDGSTFSGVCSNHVARCEPGASTLRVFNRPSTFRLPGDASRPVLMVGPGTGIAPMRAILQERSHQRRALGRKVGPNVLYFGCKNSKHDFLYEDELKEYQKAGDLAQLHLAFSREQKEKVYVQHLLRKNAKETWKMIDGDGAYVFVCGGVKMGHEVTEVLKDVFSSQGGMAPEDAKEYLAKLTEDGRYVQELWS